MQECLLWEFSGSARKCHEVISSLRYYVKFLNLNEAAEIELVEV